MPKYISSPLLKSIVSRLEALRKAANEMNYDYRSEKYKEFMSYEAELANVLGLGSSISASVSIKTLIGRIQNERRHLTNAESVVINDIAKLIDFKWEMKVIKDVEY